MPNTPAPQFQPLTGIYEPSAVQQLPDGRLLVVEDEQDHPLSLVTLAADGAVHSQALTAGLLQLFSDFWSLNDLEGLALDSAGWVYGITSHARDTDGDTKKSREKLVRFRVDGQRVVSPQVVSGLKPALTAQHPVLAAAAKVRDAKGGGGLNIEALEISPDQQRLLVGLRSPLRDGRALIATIENPAAMFDADAPPQIAPQLTELDLGGQGIRGLAHVPAMGAYLVVAGPAGRETTAFALWRWSGQPGAPAQRVTVPGLAGLERAEGVCPAVLHGQARIVIVSDDGNRQAGRCAQYLLLDPAQLQTSA